MTSQLYSYRTRSVIERIDEASTPEAALTVFGQALVERGADYFAVNFLPDPEDRIEDVCMAWQVPSEWRALYSERNYFQRDAAVRHSRRTVLPFDWATAPYDPETEPQIKEVVERARDFDTHKGLQIPIPSPSGIVGTVWVAGPHFDDREVYTSVLHSLALHVFHRVQQLGGRRPHKHARLTDREHEVLAWASEGKTAWEIGCILNLSHRTVEWHFRQAYKKLGATNRLQAMAILGATRSASTPITEAATTSGR
jgi:LuxR family transcriptional regulator, quorum-sensing system regulator BjaR1